MELTDRIVRILPVPGAGLLASDVTGRVHLLDDDLRLVRSSPARSGTVPAGQAPVYTLVCDGTWVIGKDKRGTLLRWRLDTLDLVDVLDAAAVGAVEHLLEGEEPSPQISRGAVLHEGRVYLNNGFRQIVVLDVATFTVERIEPSFAEDVALEWLCVDHPDVDVASDKAGRVFFGSLAELDFPDMVKLDGGNIHRILYDHRHGRFWATQDDGVDENDCVINGVLVLDAKGAVQHQVMLARDDIEFLDLSPDCRTVYVGGFDGVLHVLDNTEPTPRLVSTVHGFPHQLVDFGVAADRIYVLTQDGEVCGLDPASLAVVARAPFRRQCVWDIQPSAEDPDTLYVATDDGVAVVALVADPRGEPQLTLLAHHVTGLGFTRRVLAVPGGWVGLTRDQWLFRADADGGVRWRHQLGALAHTVAVNNDGTRLLACTNDGAVELDAATGARLDHVRLGDASLWAGCYLPTGERVVAAGNGVVSVLPADSAVPLWELDTDEYPKRMWSSGDTLVITGENGVKEISLATRELVSRWEELLDNTVENGVLLDDVVYAVSYGVQLAAYDRSTSEILALVEDLPDFPKGLAVLPFGAGHVIAVGGRGGYLSLYRFDTDGEPTLTRLRDLFLPRPGLRDVTTTVTTTVR
ncbi:WD40 repeat domain-containing protein [Longispora sp. K20-0274]|uniref:WD40 repeat domain-containing protein n=1 Tax=Longispora sp. K20-0274 TaxID=3088255 RepID=UPI00399B5727